MKILKAPTPYQGLETLAVIRELSAAGEIEKSRNPTHIKRRNDFTHEAADYFFFFFFFLTKDLKGIRHCQRVSKVILLLKLLNIIMICLS